MKPLTEQEYKELTLKYRVRSKRNFRVNEILDFVSGGSKYAELPRVHEKSKIIAEQNSYCAAANILAKRKEILPNIISIHVYGDRIVAENTSIQEA